MKATEKMDVAKQAISRAELESIYSYGYKVFEDVDRFNCWIFSPNRALGGKAPYDLLDTQYGLEEVKNIIGRIDYGVYS